MEGKPGALLKPKEIQWILESEKLVRLLLDSTGEAMYGLDTDGNCTFCNRAFLRMSGFEKEEDVLGKNMHDLIHHSRPDGSRYPFSECRMHAPFKIGEGIHVDDEVLCRADKTCFHAEYWSYPIKTDGEIIGAVVTFVDITERKQAERNLKRSKEFIETVINSMPDAISIINAKDYSIVDVNQVYLDQLGYTKEEVVGKKCYGITHDRDIPCSPPNDECALMNTVMTGTHSTVEHVHFDKDGNKVFVEISTSPLKDERGQVVQVVHVAKDITKRRKVEEALKESEKKYRDLVDNALVGVYKTDIRGEILFANDALAKIGGYESPEEMLGENVLNLYEDVEDRDELLKTLKEKGYVRNHELVLLKKNGEPVSVLVSGVLEGNTLSGMMLDISDRKMAEEEISNIAKFPTENPSPVLRIRKDGEIQYFNPAFENLMREKGYSIEDAFKILPEKTEEMVEKAIRSGHGIKDLEVDIDDRVLSYNISPVVDKGYVNLYASDITDRKKAEESIKKYAKELEELNRLKDLFSDIITHDLTNPIQIISMSTEQIRTYKDLPGEVNNYLNIIERAIERTTDLLDNTAVYSRLKTLEELKLQMCDLSEMLKNSVSQVQTLAKENGAIFELKYRGEYPLLCNPIVEHVFVNLLSNAIKYSPPGTTIEVDILDDGACLLSYVKDWGEGIPDKFKENLFTRFERLERGGVKGTGLGLAIAKRIVDLHHGDIWMEDNPEGGTIFWVRLPKGSSPG